MNLYATEVSVGVAPTFVALGIIYFLFIMFGVFTVRVPPENWKPVGYRATDTSNKKLVTSTKVDADTAIRTPQFWFLFAVLCLNVTAGIGVLRQASVMIEMFSADSVGERAAVNAAAAAGFVGS